MTRITVITKPDCHYCDETNELLRRLAPELGLEVEEVELATTRGQERASRDQRRLKPSDTSSPTHTSVTSAGRAGALVGMGASRLSVRGQPLVHEDLSAVLANTLAFYRAHLSNVRKSPPS